MNIELTALKNPPTTARELAELSDGYRRLFSVEPAVIFTGTLTKDDVTILENSSRIIDGWGGYKRLEFDVCGVEYCKPVGDYKLFFVEPDTVGDRFASPCTCSLITAHENSRYIGGESDCPVHGFGE